MDIWTVAFGKNKEVEKGQYSENLHAFNFSGDTLRASIPECLENKFPILEYPEGFPVGYENFNKIYDFIEKKVAL